MNKIKFLIVCAVFFMTGCTVNYDLTISNGMFDENVQIVDYNTGNWDVPKNYALSHDLSTYRELVEMYVDEQLIINSTKDRNDVYRKELIDEENILGLNLSYKYNMDKFKNSTLAYTCYKYFSVDENENIYTISTSKKFTCFNNIYPLLGGVNLNIKTDYKVLEHNADSVKNGVYTWNITKDNSDDKQILIKFEMKEKNFNIENVLTESNMTLVIILLGITILGGVLFYYIFTKNKKNNII